MKRKEMLKAEYSATLHQGDVVMDMKLEDAAKQDEPEGSVWITISATLLKKIIEEVE